MSLPTCEPGYVEVSVRVSQRVCVRADLLRCAALPPRQGIENDERQKDRHAFSCNRNTRLQGWRHGARPATSRNTCTHTCVLAYMHTCTPTAFPQLGVGTYAYAQEGMPVIVSSFSMPCLGGRAAHRGRHARTWPGPQVLHVLVLLHAVAIRPSVPYAYIHMPCHQHPAIIHPAITHMM